MRIGNTLYLDHQASTPVDPRVLKEMLPLIKDDCGNPHSTDHAYGWRMRHHVEKSASQIATLIGADSDEIIFTSGATESNNLALLGLSRKKVQATRNRILISAIEHKSILEIGRVIKNKLPLKVEVIPVDSNGFVSIEQLEKMMEEDVLAISVMAVNNEIGVMQDIQSISKIAHRSGAIFHCDATQAACSMKLSNTADHVDLLSLSAHKMHGPQGIGVLFVKRELQPYMEPIIHGGGQQQHLRSGTTPVFLCVGMGAAASLIQDDKTGDEREKLLRLQKHFVEGLAELSWPTRLNGPTPGRNRHPGNLNICFEGFNAHDILGSLQPKVAASTGSACSSGTPEPSHVLKAIGLSSNEAESSVRFSHGRFTTEADISEALCLIEEALNKTRGAYSNV